jgi:ATP-dependent Clp protease ATP-binding subunit ClpB
MLGKQGMVIRMSQAAEDWLCDMGYEPQFGARPMKRVIQREVTNELSKYVLAGDFVSGDTIYMDVADDELTFSKEPFEGAVKVLDPEEEEQKTKKAAEEKAKKDKEKEEAAIAKRKKQIQDLEKAAKDVKDAMKDLEGLEEDKEEG